MCREGQLQISLPPVVTDRNENQLTVIEGNGNMAKSSKTGTRDRFTGCILGLEAVRYV